MAKNAIIRKPKELIKPENLLLQDSSDLKKAVSLCEGYSWSCSGTWNESCTAKFWKADNDDDILF